MTKNLTISKLPKLATKQSKPLLRFSPTAWAKLLFLRDWGSTEVGAFGISPADDLLFVAEIQLLAQRCSAVSVVFDDGAVADFVDAQVDLGRQPQQFARIWIHTHPGDDPRPSSVDERTFQRVFGNCDWGVMFILARGGQAYCRLRFNAGPGGELLLKPKVDYQVPFAGSDYAAWESEYRTQVHPEEWPSFADRSLDFAPTSQQEPFFDEHVDPWDELPFYRGSV